MVWDDDHVKIKKNVKDINTTHSQFQLYSIRKIVIFRGDEQNVL